jgi:hypothetical protein
LISNNQASILNFWEVTSKNFIEEEINSEDRKDVQNP